MGLESTQAEKPDNEPDGSEKDIVVFDEADAGANTPPLIVLEAGSITTLNILYTQNMAAKASVNDWNKIKFC